MLKKPSRRVAADYLCTGALGASGHARWTDMGGSNELASPGLSSRGVC
jgi:hypothetical protein